MLIPQDQVGILTYLYAAKSVKYGGVDEVEALKMVTLNPAKLLHLDDRMGSIEV
ncbi:MAG: amidohydrolase family protein, partial [Bacteroidota bacterium]